MNMATIFSLALLLSSLCQVLSLNLADLPQNELEDLSDDLKIINSKPRPLSNGLGEDNCLISRIDTVPCNFLRKTIQRPGPNEFGVYETRYRDGDNGFPRCQILARNHRVRPLQVIGSANQVMTIYSPGIVDNPPVLYAGDLYVEYNIQCGNGRLAFLHIREMDLEPKNCLDPNQDELKCVDYLQVQGGQFGRTESCGTDLSMDYNTIPQSSLRIIFRSNSIRRFPGFAAHVTCFETRDVPELNRIANSIDGTLEQRIKFDLSKREQIQLDALTEPHFRIAQEMAQTRPTAFIPETDITIPDNELPDFEIPPKGFEEPLPVPLPQPELLRVPSPPPPTFSTTATFAALMFEDTPNPVLRAAARSITEELSINEPQRLTSLRTTFAGPDFAVPDKLRSIAPDFLAEQK